MTDPEICICAAIQFDDGRIIRGHRHHHCFAASETPGGLPRHVTSGFMTSRNRFVDRLEGRRLQDAAGIPSAAVGGYRLDLLFSEDLY